MTGPLPDWGAPWPAGGRGESAAYRAHGDPGRLLALPRELTIVVEGGEPGFLLTAVRPSVPTPQNPSYALLSFRLEAAPVPAPAATSGLDVAWEPAQITRGFLRFRASAALGPAGAELNGPFGLDWNALSATRFTLRLSPEAASIVEAALMRDALPLTALAEVEVDGISPRLPARVRIRMREAMAVLRHAAVAGRGVLGRHALGTLLLHGARETLTVEGIDPTNPAVAEQLAAALGDQIRLRFARPCPTPFDDGMPVVALPAEEAGDIPDELTWDLSRTSVAPRPVALAIDPFAEARRLVGAAGIERLVRRVVAPALPLGQHRIVITSNTPGHIAGAEMLGFQLRFPPRPPGRPHEVSRMVDLARNAVTHADIRLSPGEPLSWRARGVLAVRGPRGVEMLEGEEMVGEGPFAFAGIAAFPARFIECRARPALTALGSVVVELRAERPAGLLRMSLRLDRTKPHGYLVLPRDAKEAVMTAAAVSTDGVRIALPAGPPGDIDLDISQFEGFGAHQTVLAITFDDGAALAAIEVAPEATPAEVETYALTPAAPTREIRWFAADPFRPGFRWRWRAADNGAPASWSVPVRGPALTILSSSRETKP